MVRKNPNRYEWKMPLELVFLGQSGEQPLSIMMLKNEKKDNLKSKGVPWRPHD